MESLDCDSECGAGQDVGGMVLVVRDARGADEERRAQRRSLSQEHGHAAPHARSLEAGLKTVL